MRTLTILGMMTITTHEVGLLVGVGPLAEVVHSGEVVLRGEVGPLVVRGPLDRGVKMVVTMENLALTEMLVIKVQAWIAFQDSRIISTIVSLTIQITQTVQGEGCQTLAEDEGGEILVQGGTLIEEDHGMGGTKVLVLMMSSKEEVITLDRVVSSIKVEEMVLVLVHEGWIHSVKEMKRDEEDSVLKTTFREVQVVIFQEGEEEEMVLMGISREDH